MYPHLAFTVERLILKESRAFIDGRICGPSLRLGDVFTKVFGHSRRWNRETDEWVGVDPRPILPVALTIQSIESYRRLWDELSAGMTARLTVTGEGFDTLSEGRIIGDDAAADQALRTSRARRK